MRHEEALCLHKTGNGRFVRMLNYVTPGTDSVAHVRDIENERKDDSCVPLATSDRSEVGNNWLASDDEHVYSSTSLSSSSHTNPAPSDTRLVLFIFIIG